MSQAEVPEASFNHHPGGHRRLTLQRHLIRVDVLKLGLRNSFGIDFRSATRRVQTDDREPRSERFHYLAEVFPFIETQVAALGKKQRQAYETIKEHAVESFWQIYSDFQPMVQSIATGSGIDSDRIDPVLGRAILLFDASRRTNFVTYLEKTLRESVKNLRGEIYAQQLGIPLSAGRLVPQMSWALEQAVMQSGNALSPEESDLVVIDFLAQHPCRFSVETMQRIAEAMRQGRRTLSLDVCDGWLEPSSGSGSVSQARGNDCFVEQHDEIQFQLRQIHDAIDRAGFSANEACLVLERLGLSYDERRFQRVAAKRTTASLRKRTMRLLVRLMAARYAPQAPRFAGYLRSTPTAARERLKKSINDCAVEAGVDFKVLVDELLNWMSLSESVYRVSINERGKLAGYLLQPIGPTIPSVTFQKLKAALIEQERLGFPCWSAQPL
ncbi:MAG: hypothetical protein KDB00_02430 [Planctomycetales bacterium]|nr:hypothetical protein [Planctomycetales bacterium]